MLNLSSLTCSCPRLRPSWWLNFKRYVRSKVRFPVKIELHSLLNHLLWLQNPELGSGLWKLGSSQWRNVSLLLPGDPVTGTVFSLGYLAFFCGCVLPLWFLQDSVLVSLRECKLFLGLMCIPSSAQSDPGLTCVFLSASLPGYYVWKVYSCS